MKTIPLTLAPDSSVIDISLEDALVKLKEAINQRQAANAEHLAEQIIFQVPTSTEAYHLLYQVLSFQQKYLKLAQYAQALIDLIPNDSLSHFNLSSALRFMRQPNEALSAIEEAVKLAPSNISWRNSLGIMYKEAGKFIEAQQCFETCIDQQRDFTPPYWLRSDITPTMPEQYVEDLKEIIELSDTINNKNQVVHAAYALFKHYQSVKKYSTAFKYLTLGASTQRKGFNYNHQKELDEHKHIAKVFDSALCANPSGNNTTLAQGDCPIFICGLPRSGTTLAEQIISSHSLVTAGDELFELAQATQDILQAVKPKKQFPFWADELSVSQWSDIGETYLRLTQHINTARYFTDKMPLNYKAIGLIHKALPQAKIVYCLRPPMDLLLGAYQQILSTGNQYSYDLDELTDMIIVQYQLMKHWISVIPGKIFILDYKRLVSNQEKTTTELLNFLALDMQQGCIDFHHNKRTVHTVSNTQIRKPIFKSSINSWHKYREQLAPYAIKMKKAGLTL